MRIPIIYALCLILLGGSCNRNQKNFDTLLEDYWQEYLYFHPLEATGYGINDYNDIIRNNISDTFRTSLEAFYTKYQNKLKDFDPEKLNDNQKVSFEILSRELKYGMEYLSFPNHLLPLNQFHALPLEFAQIGSGEGTQPFENEEDYENFLSRADHFAVWCGTAIERMKEGIGQNIVLPKPLVAKIIPQYEALVSENVDSSLFFKPCLHFPEGFSESKREELRESFRKKIRETINPAYSILRDYLKKDYLSHARSSDGYDALPDGSKWYDFWVRKWTTTKKSPEEIYNIGLDEVAYLRAEMQKVMDQVEFKGDLKTFFNHCNEDAQFMPFTTAQEVLDSYQHIYNVEKSHLGDLFDMTPKTQFEIRQTEKFREATASAEYVPASEDGSRPGIFYCPIPDPKKFNAIGMETLFLHEAIPGHHYQVSLQQENKELPQFRRFLWYGAYGEGWALYAESLGQDLGLYANPYQYLGHLSDAMLRAVRLVVDVGIHTGKMSREEAIDYMLSNMRTSPAEATQEIERYMAIPGQALSYMIGKKKILELRQRTQEKKGEQFDIKKFHDVMLAHGCLPLETLDEIINEM